MKRTEHGTYEYKGRAIYRKTERSSAYNPWKVAFGPTFPTLKAAKAYVDSITTNPETNNACN